MKILAAGDIHGDTRLSERLAKKAEEGNVDLIVLCGDITQAEQSTDNLIGPFAKLDKSIVLIPGNHESLATIDFLSKIYGAKNLHGYSMKIHDIGFFGCGGANVGPNQLSEEEIFETLDKAHTYIKDTRKKVLVSHVHPSGTDMEKFTMFFPGSEGLRKAIDRFKPDLVLCSHVHEAHGIEEKMENSLLVNVGREGKIIEI